MDNNIEETANNLDSKTISESAEILDDVKQDEKKKRNILPLILILLLITIVSLGYLFLMMGRDEAEEPVIDDSEVIDKEESENLTEGPTGKIYLTLSPITSERPIAGIYEYDFSTGELKPYFEFEEDTDNLMGSFSVDRSKMTFVRRYPDYLSQVLVLDLDSKDLIEVSPVYGFLERNPFLSPDNLSVVYWFYENSEKPMGSAMTPEDNFIIMSSVGDPFLIERIKGYGAFPRFSPDGDYLIYLKNDGLYTLNLERDEESLALALDIDLDNSHDGMNVDWLNFRFNISPDGKHLIVTESLNARMSLFRISSWTPFSYEIVFEDLFAGGPMWPVFSPCGEFFVIQEGMEVSLFNLDGDKVEKLFSLSDYDPESIWITDWIVK